MTWAIVAVYVVGVILSWRSFVMSVLMGIENEGPLDTDDRVMSVFFGTFIALVWPVSLALRGIYRVVIHKEILRTPKEMEKARLEELKMLRELAKKHDLPLGE